MAYKRHREPLHVNYQWQVRAHNIAKCCVQYEPCTIALHTGNPAPFLYTPTSLLPEHSVLTDVQQATGRNGQQWITCRSGWKNFARKTEIQTDSAEIVSTSNANSARIWLGIQQPNGLYHCLSAESQKQYFSFFFKNQCKN